MVAAKVAGWPASVEEADEVDGHGAHRGAVGDERDGQEPEPAVAQRRPQHHGPSAAGVDGVAPAASGGLRTTRACSGTAIAPYRTGQDEQRGAPAVIGRRAQPVSGRKMVLAKPATTITPSSGLRRAGAASNQETTTAIAGS